MHCGLRQSRWGRGKAMQLQHEGNRWIAWSRSNLEIKPSPDVASGASFGDVLKFLPLFFFLAFLSGRKRTV